MKKEENDRDGKQAFSARVTWDPEVLHHRGKGGPRDETHSSLDGTNFCSC